MPGERPPSPGPAGGPPDDAMLEAARGVLQTLTAGRAALLQLAAAHLPFDRLLALHRASTADLDVLDDIGGVIDRRLDVHVRALRGGDRPSVAPPAARPALPAPLPRIAEPARPVAAKPMEAPKPAPVVSPVASVAPVALPTPAAPLSSRAPAPAAAPSMTPAAAPSMTPAAAPSVATPTPTPAAARSVASPTPASTAAPGSTIPSARPAVPASGTPPVLPAAPSPAPATTAAAPSATPAPTAATSATPASAAAPSAGPASTATPGAAPTAPVRPLAPAAQPTPPAAAAPTPTPPAAPAPPAPSPGAPAAFGPERMARSLLFDRSSPAAPPRPAQRPAPAADPTVDVLRDLAVAAASRPAPGSAPPSAPTPSAPPPSAAAGSAPASPAATAKPPVAAPPPAAKPAAPSAIPPVLAPTPPAAAAKPAPPAPAAARPAAPPAPPMAAAPPASPPAPEAPLRLAAPTLAVPFEDDVGAVLREDSAATRPFPSGLPDPRPPAPSPRPAAAAPPAPPSRPSVPPSDLADLLASVPAPDHDSTVVASMTVAPPSLLSDALSDWAADALGAPAKPTPAAPPARPVTEGVPTLESSLPPRAPASAGGARFRGPVDSPAAFDDAPHEHSVLDLNQPQAQSPLRTIPPRLTPAIPPAAEETHIIGPGQSIPDSRSALPTLREPRVAGGTSAAMLDVRSAGKAPPPRAAGLEAIEAVDLPTGEEPLDEVFGSSGASAGMSVVFESNAPIRTPRAAPRLTEEEDPHEHTNPVAPAPRAATVPDDKQIQQLIDGAASHARRGEFQKAIQLYTDALDMRHNLVEAHIGRGRCHLELGDYSSAMSDFARAEDHAPDRPDSHVAMGDLYFARKEYKRAIEFYDQAVEIDGSHAMARCRRGISHYYRKNYRQAHQDLQRALALDPEIPNIRKYVQMAQKKLEKGE